MIFQNPRAALNPIRKVGRQIEDVLRQHVQARLGGAHRQGDRDPRPGAHRAPARALSRLSVRALRRHVPARRHRAGARLQAATADRRRADHRPRRHHAEDRDGPRHRADARARHVDDPDHARSRPRRGLLRPRGRDGEGPRGRDRGVVEDLQGAGASLHAQADARDAAAGRVAARTAAGGSSAARGAPSPGFLARRARQPPSPRRRREDLERSPNRCSSSRSW